MMATRMPFPPFPVSQSCCARRQTVEGLNGPCFLDPSLAWAWPPVNTAGDQGGRRMTTEDTVVTSQDGRVGRILLNRPRALNALDLQMIRACAAVLETWRDDPHVHAVVIEGAGDRAFCAGGDIRALRDGQLSGDRSSVEAFFREEYDLNL